MTYNIRATFEIEHCRRSQGLIDIGKVNGNLSVDEVLSLTNIDRNFEILPVK